MDTLQALETLRVDSDASFEDVKIAYRRLALEYHPDKNNKEGDGLRFKNVTEAYHFLKNNQNKLNSSKSKPTESNWNFKNKKTKNEQRFYRKPKWGAYEKGKPPEQDWSKFTRDFEEEEPDFWQEYEREFWKNYEANINARNDTGKEYKKQEKEPKIDLSVFVDPSLCIGCCSCEVIAPEVFIIDKISKMNPKSQVHNEKGAGYNKIMNAAETCPTKAINVTDKKSNEKLYPW